MNKDGITGRKSLGWKNANPKNTLGGGIIMPLLRCTQKLLKKLKVVPADTEDSDPSDSTLGDWYANVLRLDRKQCVLFVNDWTLFSFIAVRVSLKPQIVKDAFLNRLNYVLIEEGFPPDKVLEVCEEYQDVGFAKTASRSVLGSMNDLTRMYEIHIDVDGGLDRCDMSALTAKVNRTPQKNLEWSYSIDILENHLS